VEDGHRGQAGRGAQTVEKGLENGVGLGVRPVESAPPRLGSRRSRGSRGLHRFLPAAAEVYLSIAR
jgi:hypothetical protein